MIVLIWSDFPKLITQPLRNTPESRGDEFRAISAPKLSPPSSKSTYKDIFNFSDAFPRFGTIRVKIMTSLKKYTVPRVKGVIYVNVVSKA